MSESTIINDAKAALELSDPERDHIEITEHTTLFDVFNHYCGENIVPPQSICNFVVKHGWNSMAKGLFQSLTGAGLPPDWADAVQAYVKHMRERPMVRPIRATPARRTPTTYIDLQFSERIEGTVAAQQVNYHNIEIPLDEMWEALVEDYPELFYRLNEDEELPEEPTPADLLPYADLDIHEITRLAQEWVNDNVNTYDHDDSDAEWGDIDTDINGDGIDESRSERGDARLDSYQFTRAIRDHIETLQENNQ